MDAGGRATQEQLPRAANNPASSSTMGITTIKTGYPMNFLFAGAIGGFLAVGINAFGAHALKGSLSEYSMGIFNTAASYQFYHSLALLLVALFLQKTESGKLVWSGRFFVLGTVLFSGSLYTLSLTGIKWFGAITPVGGVCFLAGWLMLALFAFKEYKQ